MRIRSKLTAIPQYGNADTIRFQDPVIAKPAFQAVDKSVPAVVARGKLPIFRVAENTDNRCANISI